ncbi:MAG: signal peptidase I [Candidatus Aenigmarchaeota archaeon]|nr:signal peptidase I [Candidatus Aenigmarchaeota archaeon]
MSIQSDLKDFISMFILAVLFYYLLGLVLNTNMPLVSVVSDSMIPGLHRGDVLLVSGYGPYEKGDVVIYFKKEIGYPIVHRIVGFVNITEGNKTEEMIITKGDNNRVRDCWSQILYNKDKCWSVSKKEIRGKMIIGVPLAGYPKLILKSPVNFVRCDILGMNRMLYCTGK